MRRAPPRDARGADRVWSTLVALVMDTRQEWKRRVTEATGLPFGRVRALWRLEAGPLTLGELAASMGIDAPAATVAVGALEKLGLVLRQPHPSSGRMKLVHLTPQGARVLGQVRSVQESAPPEWQALGPEALALLEVAVERMAAAREPSHGAGRGGPAESGRSTDQTRSPRARRPGESG